MMDKRIIIIALGVWCVSLAAMEDDGPSRSALCRHFDNMERSIAAQDIASLDNDAKVDQAFELLSQYHQAGVIKNFQDLHYRIYSATSKKLEQLKRCNIFAAEEQKLKEFIKKAIDVQHAEALRIFMPRNSDDEYKNQCVVRCYENDFYNGLEWFIERLKVDASFLISEVQSKSRNEMSSCDRYLLRAYPIEFYLNLSWLEESKDS